MRAETKIEKEWDIDGLHCLVVFTPMGHRCGYVGVPKGHWLFGLGYSEEKYDNSLDDVVYVHGGLTFADYYEQATNEDYWYFGFDCCHYDDAPDLNSAYEYGFIEDVIHTALGGTIRTFEYVEREVVDLANQIKNLKLRDKTVKELYIGE